MVNVISGIEPWTSEEKKTKSNNSLLIVQNNKIFSHNLSNYFAYFHSTLNRPRPQRPKKEEKKRSL